MQTGKLKWNFHRNLNPFFEFNYNNNSNKKGNKKNKKASLTSNHSVAPTLPYSPPLQLAKIMLLRGLNPSDSENM